MHGGRIGTQAQDALRGVVGDCDEGGSATEQLSIHRVYLFDDVAIRCIEPQELGYERNARHCAGLHQ